jgi:hypothetical protein
MFEFVNSRKKKRVTERLNLPLAALGSDVVLNRSSDLAFVQESTVHKLVQV